MTLSEATGTTAQLNLKDLPKGSCLRLYNAARWGNSFSLDGFPALQEGKDWASRLVEIIECQGALGMTTNPTLFRVLMDEGALDARLRALKAEGKETSEIYHALYNEAAMQAAQIFQSIHTRWPWEGRVSQEASALITEPEPLVRDVRRIAQAMQGVGAFTKIPNLSCSPEVIRQTLSGEPVVHPNVTLVFSDRHYLDTVEGYLNGLTALAERLITQGTTAEQIRKQLNQVHSVNSLFVSRTDRVVDPMIDRALEGADTTWQERLNLLKGKTAVAYAKKIYQIFEAIFLGKPFQDPAGLYADAEGRAMQARIQKLAEQFKALQAAGCNPQRLLVASTGVKSEQPYSGLLYVLPFLGPWVVNTLPEKTLALLSRFVEIIGDAEAHALKTRSMISEPLPKLRTDSEPAARWDEALLMTPRERQKLGIEAFTADEILLDVQQMVLAPQGTTLRRIGDTLRDKGAAAFSKDETETLGAIEKKLSLLS